MPDNKQVKKPKPGGLFYNNKTAFVDSTLNANRDKEWVRRLYQKNTPKVTLPGEDKPSTHLMADDGNGYVFPTLIQQPNQKGLTNMGPYAEKYARSHKTGIQFKNKEQGDYFASNDNGNGSFGGYKKGTGVLSEFPKGVKSLKIDRSSIQDTTSPKNIVKGGGTSTQSSEGWVGASRSLLPINAAMFIQDLAGNKTPLTEKDLKPSEISSLRRTTRNAQKSSLQYGYNDNGKYPIKYADYPVKNNTSLVDNIRGVNSRMRTTIGRANVEDSPVDNSSRIKDTFDFNNPNRDLSISDIVSPKSGYALVRDIAGSLGSKDGEGPKVDINLGNLKRPTKQEEESGKFMKGTRKIKVKKAVNGLQDVTAPQQQGVSGALSKVTTAGASGAAAGSSAGPIGSLIGAGVSIIGATSNDVFNAKKIRGEYTRALATNRDNMINRQYAGDEETINQAPQRFKKGTKMIEIEGKKTPEIHTDKNFNVKNLGSIPHSKGGNKVEAEEGDIVFNTQNSLTKYNKIASALQEGDKTTLTKEKNKLPEDKGSKNQTGNKGVKDDRRFHYNSYGDKIYDDKVGSYKVNIPVNVPSSKRPQGYVRPSQPIRDFFTPKPFTPDAKLADGSRVASSSPTTKKPTETFKDGYKLPLQNGYVAPKATSKAPVNTPTTGKSVKKTTPVTSVVAPTQSLASIKFNPGNLSTPDLSELKGSRSLDQVAESAKGMSPLDSSNKAISSSSKTTSPVSGKNTGQGINNALQFAGVANNLIQGFKPEPKIDEAYYNPDKIKYTDRSQSLRNQSNQAANAQIATARNLSGGNAGNLRANATAARIDNLNRQGGIDEREQARADAVNTQNTEISNQAKTINLGRRDNYQQINLADKAAKQSYIDQAASDIGQYGMAKTEENYMRSRDDKTQAAQMAGYNSINGRYQHKSNLDGSTYFEPDADTSITRFGNGITPTQTRRKRTLGIFKNGTKSIKTNYKLKSVV